jgi:two-component system sensor histidine kinase AlgZ
VPRREGDNLFLPDLCGLRPLFLVLLLAQSIAIVLTLGRAGSLEQQFEAFGFISLFTQILALSVAAALCLARSPLSRMRESVAVAASYALTVLVTLLVAEAAWRALAYPGGDPAVIDSGHGAFLARVAGISAVVNALALRYFFVQHHWRAQVAAESRARVQALQSRIRPHFFFNCMNTIASLTRSSPELAERAVEDLAALFRASLADAQALVTLGDELELVRRYLAIEHLRLGDRLQVRWQIADAPMEARLPSLSIQPLVENAIYHGIEPLATGGTIDIAAHRGDGFVAIDIENPVAPEATPAQGGHRMAQRNVAERLAAHFGPQAQFTAERDGARYRVHLKFPYASGS